MGLKFRKCFVTQNIRLEATQSEVPLLAKTTDDKNSPVAGTGLCKKALCGGLRITGVRCAEIREHIQIRHIVTNYAVAEGVVWLFVGLWRERRAARHCTK